MAEDRGEGVERALALIPSAVASTDGDPGSAPVETRLMLIDGDRDGDVVLFDHDAHKQRLGADTSCATCHHMSLPLERNTSCAACHRDMYDTTDLFDHTAHEKALGGNAGCVECHAPGGAAKTRATSTACMECHRDDEVESRIIDAPAERWRAAASYMDAMHGLCVTCHKQEVQDSTKVHPEGLDQCRACHDADRRAVLERLKPSRERTAGPIEPADGRSGGPIAGGGGRDR